ncbi:hypothetical protein EX30DRAFT_397253 [Ascodesmis nigricans]|uniref:Cytochrome b mRNA-processing protein 4 n=1 Tax=Ascodesmis nigricans TaxID=341454 RepID=A0A4S2MSQ4_9PEZI|nr:hypothetical protein EX30DRAFT_397253 [Ascodesmis nigricans]
MTSTISSTSTSTSTALLTTALLATTLHRPLRRPLAPMRASTIIKMGVTAVVCCVGGPALVYYVQPSSEELFKQYNPELQKKVLEQREERMKEYEEHMRVLKEQASADRPFWIVAAAAEKKKKKAIMQQTEENRKHLADMRKEMMEEQNR